MNILKKSKDLKSDIKNIKVKFLSIKSAENIPKGDFLQNQNISIK